jgi:hypothetical protein
MIEKVRVWTDYSFSDEEGRMSIPKNITTNEILKVATEIDQFGVPRGRRSKKYVCRIQGKEYPPKYLIGQANLIANGQKLPPASFNGGSESNRFFRALGLEIFSISTGQLITSDRQRAVED